MFSTNQSLLRECGHFSNNSSFSITVEIFKKKGLKDHQIQYEWPPDSVTQKRRKRRKKIPSMEGTTKREREDDGVEHEGRHDEGEDEESVERRKLARRQEGEEGEGEG